MAFKQRNGAGQTKTTLLLCVTTLRTYTMQSTRGLLAMCEYFIFLSRGLLQTVIDDSNEQREKIYIALVVRLHLHKLQV